MLLRAAIVPPGQAVDELWTATRLLRAVPGVAAVAREWVEVDIAAFGNLLPADCARLAGVLRSSFGGADAPTLWFDGLEVDDAGQAVVGLGGDVEQIADLARFVPEAAEKMRLYVDRRRFRPRVRVATVSPEVSASLLEPALAPLAAWRGAPWPVPGLSLLRTRWVQGAESAEEYDLIEMA